MRAAHAQEAKQETEPKIGKASGAGARWVLLIPNVPSSPSYARVKIWRRLQTVGAVALKNSVYVLPNRDECVEVFQWIAREVVELGGQASLCETRFFDPTTDEQIERRFVEERNADYASIAADARTLARSLQAKRLGAERLSSLESRVARLKQRFDEIAAIDFAHAPGREAAEGLVRELGQMVAARRGAARQSEPLAHVPRPSRAVWVTRTGVHIDRIASAWLIRRFIDPEATLKFVPAKGYVPEPGELRFDMYDAEFTHIGDRCTFEVLLERMRIDDFALRAVADIVHDIDLRDQKHGRDETVGIQNAITGLCAAHREDSERVAAGSTLFDSLYAFFSLRRRGQKGESGS